MIGTLTAFKEDLRGISDEGNIMLRTIENGLTRELILILLLSFYTFIIVRYYKTFRFPDNFKRKKLLFFTICFLTVVVSLTYPKLDQLIFGV